MNLKKINEILVAEPSYRLKQIKRAVFVDLITDWLEATNLTLALREKLNTECPLTIAGELIQGQADNNVQKAILTLADGLKIETVLMRHKTGRQTVCVSSQVGCALACTFCATGQNGFKRNLSADEIVEQVLFFQRVLKNENSKVNNVVFMGMGEPLLNYEAVLAAIKTINDPLALGIGMRHISVSTVGIVENIKKLATEDLQINLALSLHASNNELRSKIMPINKKFALAEVLKAMDFYAGQTNRRVMLEYIMIKDFNDQLEQARELVGLIRKSFKAENQKLVFVNLIAYNPTGIFEPAADGVIKNFHDYLMQEGIDATIRFRFGGDINAACGQLVYGKNNLD
ncbi:MAG TPA: 23S rRNA (adenine(2503)-C(2))-methyltransferase RlmN [bacterium]|nr:23S rRNA (adenine(2503)-C(2))-methyltransferase RlmN [bacterium]